MNNFNQAQHIAMLCEISVAAARVAEMALMIQERAGADVEADVLAAAVSLTAQRIGWMADAAYKAHLEVLPAGLLQDTWNMPAVVVAEGESTASTTELHLQQGGPALP